MRMGSWPAWFLPCTLGVREKFARPCLFIRLEGYAVRVEDLSKTETKMERLSLENQSPENSLVGEQGMSEPAVVSPATFVIARPEPGEYAPYYDRYISLIAGTDILVTL